ncbi:MAG: hypothetical protein ACTSWL_02060 [Promethearchaeota archaeon]
MILIDPDLLIAIGVLLGVIIVAILLNTIALKMGIKAVKGEKSGLGRVFLTSLLLIFLTGIFSAAFGYFFPGLLYVGSIISLLIEIFIIKGRHNTTFLGALGALIIYVIVLVIIIVLIWLFFASLLAPILTLLGI